MIRVRSAETRNDAMTLLSVLSHVKLEAISTDTIILILTGKNKLRKKTVEGKFGNLPASVKWYRDNADIEECLKAEALRAKYSVEW